MHYFTLMKPLLLLALIAFSSTVTAQEKKLLFYDQDWKPSHAKKYSFIVEQKKLSDTCYEWNYYEATSPRFLSVQFKSPQGGTMHGKYIAYTSRGYIDTSGFYLNGKKHGQWDVMASNHRVLRRLIYMDDVLTATKDSNEVNKENKIWRDALKEKGTDTIEIESEFPGAAGSWGKYLGNNLRYPKQALSSNSQGVVHVQFIVNEQGQVTDIDIRKSAEYYLDQEALRLITASPKWIPAVQGGKKVKSYKIQPIDFRFQ